MSFEYGMQIQIYILASFLATFCEIKVNWLWLHYQHEVISQRQQKANLYYFYFVAGNVPFVNHDDIFAVSCL